MSDKDIFAQGESSETPATPADVQQASPATFQIPDEVAEYVGEGKKYASVEDALKSIPHANQFIEQLKNEKAELRQDLDSRLSVEDAITSLQSETQQGTETPSATPTDPAELQKMIVDTLNNRDTAMQAANNLNDVTESLVSHYGSPDKATEQINVKAQELGMSVDSLKELAATSPKAFMAQFDIDSKPNSNPDLVTSSSVNTEQLNTQAIGQAKPGTYAYWSNLRKENPSAYHSPENAMQRMKDAANPGFYEN